MPARAPEQSAPARLGAAESAVPRRPAIDDVDEGGDRQAGVGARGRGRVGARRRRRARGSGGSRPAPPASRCSKSDRRHVPPHQLADLGAVGGDQAGSSPQPSASDAAQRIREATARARSRPGNPHPGRDQRRQQQGERGRRARPTRPSPAPARSQRRADDVPVIERPYGVSKSGTSVPWTRAEQAPDLLGNRRRFTFEPSVGDADRPCSRRPAGQRRVARSRSKAARWSMERVAVELDDQPLARPEGIDLVAENVDVGRRRRQVVLLAEERQSAPRDRSGSIPARAPPRSGAGSAASARRPMPRAQTSSSARISSSSKPIGLFERPSELPLVDDFGEVEERARDGGDRDIGDHASGRPDRSRPHGPRCPAGHGRPSPRLQPDGREGAIRAHRAAALRWLSNAPSPQASTAAIHVPARIDSPSDRTRRRRDAEGEGGPPRAVARSSAAPSPPASSCRRATTPCWRVRKRRPASRSRLRNAAASLPVRTCR